MTFGRNIQKTLETRVEFACFSFHVGLLFYQLFCLYHKYRSI